VKKFDFFFLIKPAAQSASSKKGKGKGKGKYA
jgi:hypothetical protein